MAGLEPAIQLYGISARNLLPIKRHAAAAISRKIARR